MKNMRVKKAEFKGSYVDIESLPASGLPEIALAGRSNVGKSSLINCLANRRNLALTSSTPGNTRTINYYLFDDAWFLVDLPGYGYAKVSQAERKRWSLLIEKYLKERRQLKGVVQVVDIRHHPTETDKLMSEWLGYHQIPRIVVATKADKIARGKWKTQLAAIQRELRLSDPPLCFSSLTGEGRDELVRAIGEMVGIKN